MIPHRRIRQLLWCVGIGLISVGGWAGASQSAAELESQQAAEAVLKQVYAATPRVRTLAADIVVTRTHGKRRERLTGKVRLMRPNLARVELKGKQPQTVVSDGKTLWVYNASTDQYTKRAVDRKGEEIAKSIGPLIAVGMFFKPTLVTANAPPTMRAHIAERGSSASPRYDVVALTIPGMEIRLYAASNRLVYKSVSTIKREAQPASIETELSDVVVNAPIARSTFSYRPPKTARKLHGPIEIEVVQPSGKRK